MTAADFVASLPPPVTWQEEICIAETIRRDLKLAAASAVLPADAKFWIRSLSHSPVVSVEFAVWTGAVLANDYAAAVMDGLLARRDVQWKQHILKESQDARLSPEVNEALALVKFIGDRRIAEAMEERPMNYYGLIQYRLEIKSSRLIDAAMRGIKIEVDPEYADFMHRAQEAASRLGRQAVRSICGEGGVDLSDEQGLQELVRLDNDARGRLVTYSRRHGRWVVAEEEHAW